MQGKRQKQNIHKKTLQKLVSGFVVSFLSFYYQPPIRPFVEEKKKNQETHQLTVIISSKYIF